MQGVDCKPHCKLFERRLLLCWFYSFPHSLIPTVFAFMQMQALKTHKQHMELLHQLQLYSLYGPVSASSVDLKLKPQSFIQTFPVIVTSTSLTKITSQKRKCCALGWCLQSSNLTRPVCKFLLQQKTLGKCLWVTPSFFLWPTLSSVAHYNTFSHSTRHSVHQALLCVTTNARVCVYMCRFKEFLLAARRRSLNLSSGSTGETWDLWAAEGAGHK